MRASTEIVELMGRVAVKDRAAFAELYRATSGKLFGTALRILRRRDIAEGFSALTRVMRRSPAQTAERTCQFVQTAMLGTGTRTDDVCILTIRPVSIDGSRRGAGTGRRRVRRLRITVGRCALPGKSRGGDRRAV